MWSFFGGRRDQPKKAAPEREVDSFVIVGETVAEQTQKIKNVSIAKPATNVIVLPTKSSSGGSVRSTKVVQGALSDPAAELPPNPSNMEAGPSTAEFLVDVPFTLAPHVLAMQAGPSLLPEVLLSRDMNDNLASFCYDFTLENSVLCDS
ncbi:UBAP1-MVB12-associated (UMA)-domain containing protein 1 [Denticeps clupeoides]|uniref:UBAP1-MVB12-associated (UMA)-domain containing protein 1 n=1 Tax=Denticeps clupeoides TaxID=299321 RepID=UPI0010A513CA|nr:UBAP1-MVB12-associated (UMA)-domain containing protein 1 [Denticeps clupeoides]XP_028819276.1 UBAP1-MVB12-associated (UMA)-domain containing protein 1 [Denticeps clupeoides]